MVEKISQSDKAKAAETYLLQTAWGEGCGFNLWCPDDSAGQCYKTYTGSLSVAMAQVMKYYSFPENGIKKREYWSNYRLECFNFQSAGFQFNQMPVGTQSNPEVARLIYACAVSLRQNFSIYIQNFNCSLINIDSVRGALLRYWKYDNKMQVVTEMQFGSFEKCMPELVKFELQNKRPIIYEAYPQTGCSRVMIIDGYRPDDQKFHLNTGIYFFNGWYCWGAFNLFQSMHFNTNPKILIGVRPIFN